MLTFISKGTSFSKNVRSRLSAIKAKKPVHYFLVLCMAAVCCIPVSCNTSGESNSENSTANDWAMLSGAGSTFANPLYSKMIDKYRSKTGTETTYSSIGSSGGIKSLMDKKVDFGASDAYLSDDEMNMFPAKVLQFPTCLGAVVITYNLQGNPELKLTPDIIAGIFLGQITNWNNSAIKAENPNVALPDEPITVVHRADGSGTSFIFSDYLSKISPEWKTKIGVSKTPNWPVGLSGAGNEGVSSTVKLTPGAIGYVELIYALQKDMGFALIKNASGNYIKASMQTTSLAANVDMPADARISITNSAIEDAYPISSFTWIMIYREQDYDNRSKERVVTLLKELWWMVHEGQQYTTTLNYAPLPPKAVAAAEKALKSVTYDGLPAMQD